MYRNLFILTALILSLSACGSNEAPQTQHDASLSKALTAMEAVDTEVTTTVANCENCPVNNGECNSTPEKCAEMGIECPKMMAENGECPSAATMDCPSMSDQGCPKTATMTDKGCPQTAAMAEQGCPTSAAMLQSTAVEAAETVIAGPTTSILTLSLENDFGAVFVPHSQHVEMYSCDTCHPTVTPGKIDKTKKEFHALCRGCHADEKSGPTKCRGCHQR